MQSDATALADAIGVGKLSASEAMQASLDMAAKFTSLGAITHCDSELGRQAASDYDAAAGIRSKRDRAIFGGVPTLAKDLGGPFLGLPIRAGSKALDHVDSEADSELALRFRKSGLCFFGVTTTPEFGLSLASEPAIGPVCRNPLNDKLTPGGSSGGSAAAVAAGIVSIAHATDAGGSIRIPAACCGLVGLKPSRGAIPSGPAFGNHLGGLASELMVCRSVRDTAAIFNAVSGNAHGPFPPIENATDQPEKLRVGVIKETGSKHPTDNDRSETVEQAAKSLEAQGHTIMDLHWDDFAQLVDDSAQAFAAIVSVNLANLFAALELDMTVIEKISQAAISYGKAFTGTELWKLQNKMVLVSRDLWQIFEDIDCLLSPMLATAPKPLGSFPSEHDEIKLHFDRMTAFAPLATLANASGFPAITLPFGTDSNALPLPVQLMAPMGHENHLFTLAASLESEQRWQHRFPVAGLA